MVRPSTAGNIFPTVKDLASDVGRAKTFAELGVLNGAIMIGIGDFKDAITLILRVIVVHQFQTLYDLVFGEHAIKVLVHGLKYFPQLLLLLVCY